MAHLPGTEAAAQSVWPDIPYPAWKETCATLQLWTQVVGKVRLARTPWLNHSWHVALYVTARGLTTGLIPHERKSFELEVDFTAQRLSVTTTEGHRGDIALEPRSIASFYAEVMTLLRDLEVPVAINRMPNEIPDAIPFDQDHRDRAYDGEKARLFWRALVEADRVLKEFRSGFIGKASPVHFFWGSFDLAVTRFSGRRAPQHPGGVPNLPDDVAREGYSHEVSSAGFWPGGNGIDYPAFYSYAYPPPPGFRDAAVRPAAAAFNSSVGEFLLPYDAVRTAEDPDATLLEFLQSTYDAAANLAGWDRSELDCLPGRPGVPRPA